MQRQSCEDVHSIVQNRLEEALKQNTPPVGTACNKEEIFFHMLRIVRDKNVVAAESLQFGQVASNTLQNFRALIRKPALLEAFTSIVDIKALEQQMLVGKLGPLVRTKCVEEVSQGLTHVLTGLHYLFGGIENLRTLSLQTLQQLEQRCPAYSRRDCREVQTLFSKHEIMAEFQCRDTKAEVLSRIMTFPCLIPSLSSFLHNTDWLCVIANELRKLFDFGSKHTLRQAMSESFLTPHEASHWGTGAFHMTDFDVAYYRLVLYVMGEIEDICPQALKTGHRGGRSKTGKNAVPKPVTPKMSKSDPFIWHELGEFAAMVGFRSRHIKVELDQDPAAQSVHQFLAPVSANSTALAGDGERIEAARQTLDQLQARTRRHRQWQRQDLTEDISEYVPLNERVGRPYAKHHRRIKDKISLSKMISMRDSDQAYEAPSEVSGGFQVRCSEAIEASSKAAESNPNYQASDTPSSKYTDASVIDSPAEQDMPHINCDLSSALTLSHVKVYTLGTRYLWQLAAEFPVVEVTDSSVEKYLETQIEKGYHPFDENLWSMLSCRSLQVVLKEQKIPALLLLKPTTLDIPSWHRLVSLTPVQYHLEYN